MPYYRPPVANETVLPTTWSRGLRGVGADWQLVGDYDTPFGVRMLRAIERGDLTLDDDLEFKVTWKTDMKGTQLWARRK